MDNFELGDFEDDGLVNGRKNLCVRIFLIDMWFFGFRFRYFCIKLMSVGFFVGNGGNVIVCWGLVIV